MKSPLPSKILAFGKRTILPFVALMCVSGSLQLNAAPLDKLNLPEGFEISVYAEMVNPRQMALGSDGVLYVGSRRAGAVYAVIDENKDFVADQVITIDKGLKMPTGVTLRDGDLYVAAVTKILKYEDIGQHLDNPPKPVIAVDGLPNEHHGWKYIKFGPDDLLYFNIGAPCNICLRENPWFSSIMTADLRTKPATLDVYAHGVRNTVGFTWHPTTSELWFTDNGRDMMGDELPPCELNRAAERGLHFGYPFVHGNDVMDPKFGDGKSANDYIAPMAELGAHVAPLGVIFYTGDMFPDSYKNKILIAEHGSWNRTPEAGHVGYRITTVSENANGDMDYDVFIDGWLQNNIGEGRPVDLLQLPDGSLLISDDSGNVIYRLTYSAA